MRRIYLFCDNGMSTSMMAQRMQNVANDHKLPVEVKAFGSSRMDEIVNEFDPDVILLGPQVKHLYNKVVEKYGHRNKPITVIDAGDYGTMNGERVLKICLKMIKESEKQN